MRRRQLTFLALTAAVAFGLLAPGGAAAHGKRGIEHIVVIYQENHSFDNLYGGWEGVNGLGRADRRTRRRSTRTASRTTACCRTTSTSTSPPLPADCTTHGTPSRATSATGRSRSTTTSRPTDTTCPAPGVVRARTACSRAGLPGGCTRDLVHRFYQEQYQLDGGEQDRYVDRQRRGRPDDGRLRHARSCRSTATCTGRATRTTRSPTTSSRARSAARSSTTSGWSPRPRPIWPDAVNDGGSDDLHSVRRRQRHADQLPALHAAARAPCKDQALTRVVQPGPGRARRRPASCAATTRSTRSSRRTSRTRRARRRPGGCRRRPARRSATG